MRDILGSGIAVGVLTAAWCYATGGSPAFAVLAYSVGGTSTAMLTAVFLAARPETERPRLRVS